MFLYSFSSRSRETLRFDVNKEISVISDKAYRISSENRFQAVGNVIILHFDNSIYGEKADISFNTGEVVVEGNVRYVGPGMTVYGSKLYYNMQTKQMNIESARVLSENYSMLGKTLSQVGPGKFEGEEAEYTTCKDCPESWSIYGKKINITQGEYIRIKHGYLKIKGVIAFYFPYLIFPIKKERESGILFPRLGFNFADGIRYQQPYYHVLNDSSDLTLTPSTWGKRGFGGQIEHRYFLNDKSWYLFETLFADDAVYEPFKDEITLSGRRNFRHFSSWEHHYNRGLWFNHHFKYIDPSDLDLVRDYDFYTLGKLQGSEVGGETFFDFRLPLVSASIFAGHYKNLLFRQPRDFDNRYVQVQPEVDINLMPLRLFQSDNFFIRNAFFNLRSTWTNFKQNHISEENFIRNSSRYHLYPQLNINYLPLGPLNLSTRLTYDGQRYSFRNGEENFSKSVYRYENEISFEVDKVFGFSYQTKIPSNLILKKEKPTNIKESKPKSFENLVGELNLFGQDNKDEDAQVVSNSYRHRQIYKLKHYLLSDITGKGNNQFFNQIRNIEGQFDRRDALRQDEFQNNEESSITIPLINTLELNWENSIIKKSPILSRKQNPANRLIDEFTFNRIAYFDVSQAYNLDSDAESVRNRLTRLYINTGINLENFNFRISEYYFYDSQEHILSTGVGFNLPFLRFNLGYIYNTETDPIRKLVNFSSYINLFSRIELNANYEYDIELRTIPRANYNLIYSPLNDCWKLNVNYQKNLIEGRLSFNFLIKFNDRNFSSLSDIM